MDLLEKKKQDNAGEITAVILGSWRLFNEELEQREGRANDIFGSNRSNNTEARYNCSKRSSGSKR
jgi:hypothetical protein